MLTIHDDGGPRPWLVHLAVPCDRSHRIETYVTKVASRSSKTPRRTGADRLTRRECEVLTLLAEDHDLNRIANELCISYTTVRNHVQHILTKLHVHSIVEAVACHLVKKQGDKD